MDDENNKDVALQITEKLRIINGDNDSFILQEAYMSEKANTVLWRNKGYYSDVLTCLYTILRRMPIKQGDTLVTYTERFEKMYEFLYLDTLGKANLRAKMYGGKGAEKEEGVKDETK